MGYRSNKTPGVVCTLFLQMNGETANWRLDEAEMKTCKVSVDISDESLSHLVSDRDSGNP